MKKINFQRFEKNLEKYQKDEDSQSEQGLANVIRYIWNQYPTKYVDFDIFSLDDVMQAMDALSAIPVSDEDDDYLDGLDQEDVKKNPWYQNMIIENTVATLFHTKKKIYENDDDFI